MEAPSTLLVEEMCVYSKLEQRMTALEATPVRVSSAELARRWAAVRGEMAERGIDALVVRNDNDWVGGYVRWFSDVPANNGYPRTLVLHRDDLMTLVEVGPFDGREMLGGKDDYHRGVGERLTAPAFAPIAYTHTYDGELVAAILGRRGYRTVGLVAPNAQAKGFLGPLDAALAGKARIVDATDFVDAIKTVKSAEEIAFIRATAALQDAAFAKAVETIRPGLRDVDVVAAAWHEAQILGSEQGVILGGSAPLGTPSRFVGRHQQGRRINSGDHLTLLIEVNGPGGYYGELARTIVLGRASAELADGFAATRELQAATLAQMKPGAACADISAAHDAAMAARSLPLERRVYSHGQGYDMVERPLIRGDEPGVLVAGTCLAVHPQFETGRVFAVICDNYIIGAAGPGECLHRTEKKIFEVA